MRSLRSVSLAILVLAAFAMDAAVAPSSGIESVRAQLSSYFRDIERNSPTMLGGLAKSPEAMAAIQKRIATMSDEELRGFQQQIAAAPDWKVAPEAFASAFPPAVLEEARRAGADYAKQIPKGEVMRDDVRALARVLELLPDAKLKELGIDRKMIAALDATFSGMTPMQAAVFQKHTAETTDWRERSAMALHSLPPALQRGAAALAEHGPLTEADVKELEGFRRDLIALLTRISKLPQSAQKTLNIEAMTSQIEQLRSAPPDVLFMVRHNIPADSFNTLRGNVAYLEKVSNFSAEEKAGLEDFRSDLARAFKQVRSEDGQEWQDAEAVVAKLAPEHLYLLQKRMAALGSWQVALPAMYQTLADPRTAANLRAVQGLNPDPAAVQSLETFRRQALAYVDAVQPTVAMNPTYLSGIRTTLQSVPLERLELIREANDRMPATATAADRLSLVAIQSTNFNCSLTMTAVPEVCFPRICDPTGLLGCTDAYCTPAVTVTANFDVICNPIEAAIDATRAGITSAANAAVETMRSAIQTSINGVQSSINASISSVNAVINSAVSVITSTVNDIWSFLQTIPDLAWTAIKSALNLLLDIRIKNGVTLRDLVASGTETALNSMKTLLGLGSGWWTSVQTFTLPQIPCPPAGFHTPFGNVGDGAAAANYARYKLMIDNIIGMIPDTEISLKIKIPAQITYMMFDFLGLCLEQASADADAAELTSRHELVLTNFTNLHNYVESQIADLTAASGAQTSSLLSSLTSQSTTTQTAIGTQSAIIQNLINSQNSSNRTLVTNRVDEIQALFQSESDASQQDVKKFRDLDLMLTIERVLQGGTGSEIASLQLPEPWGYLGVVKDVVAKTIQSMTVAQEGTGLAQSYYDSAVILMNGGKYKDAFREFIKAYVESTKGKV
jgi:hypothetical protein